MTDRLRLLCTTLLLSLAAGAAQARSIDTSNNNGNEGPPQSCELGTICLPPPPPRFRSTPCEPTFSGAGTQDFDCLNYQLSAGKPSAQGVAGAQGVLGLFKNIAQINSGNGVNNALFAAPNFRAPQYAYTDLQLGTGSGNALFDAVFDATTRQGMITLLQSLDDEFMVSIGGNVPSEGKLEPFDSYFFFSASSLGKGAAFSFDLSNTAGALSPTEVTLYTLNRAVPEPGTLVLVGSALAGLLAFSRRRPAPAR